APGPARRRAARRRGARDRARARRVRRGARAPGLLGARHGLRARRAARPGARRAALGRRAVADAARPARRRRARRGPARRPPRRAATRVARIDLLGRRAEHWCDARIDACAYDFDGALWFVAAHGALLAVDATAAPFGALWRTGGLGPIAHVARNSARCVALVP